MKFLILLFGLLLTGCATSIPVAPKFPDAPAVLLEKCSLLKTIPTETTVFSEMTKIIVENYGMYHECAAAVEAWQEWHKDQKRIYKEVR